MKKILLSILVVALLGSIYSCKKDINNQLPDQQQDDEMIKRSEKVVTLIRNFQKEMSDDLKSGGTMSLDSAIWNMEASLNYDYAQPDSASLNFITRKSVYTLTIDANEISSITDIETVYGLMEDTLVMQFNALSNTVKIIVLSDVSLDSIDGTLAHISVTNGFGLDLPSAYWPFYEDDDWIWGTENEGLYPPAGKCTDTTMIGVSDGSNELSFRLNNPLLQDGEQFFFTDIESFGVHYLNCIYNEPPNLPRVYSVSSGPESDFCMYNEDLTFFLQAADWIIYDFNDISNDNEDEIFLEDGEGARPFGKDFVSIEITDYFDAGHSKFFHYYDISYGIKTYGSPTD